jgi:hypothetical protein
MSKDNAYKSQPNQTNISLCLKKMDVKNEKEERKKERKKKRNEARRSITTKERKSTKKKKKAIQMEDLRKKERLNR